MAKFITKHSTTECRRNDYDTLHTELEKKNYLRGRRMPVKVKLTSQKLKHSARKETKNIIWKLLMPLKIFSKIEKQYSFFCNQINISESIVYKIICQIVL